jgi:hypothetical protein
LPATSRFHRIVLLSALVVLSACAGDVAKPVAVQEIAPPQKLALRVSDVTAEAQPGVTMASYELDRIVSKVKSVLPAVSGSGAPPASTGAAPMAKIRMVFTQYDKGNAFARFMLIGTGQIKIDADVYFVDDATGQQIGKYQVSKQFAFGGIYGGSTSVEDVEDGFAKSVAEILKPKT